MDQITHRIAAVRESSTRRSRYGIAGFTAEVLVDNRAMRHVFHKSGLEVQSKLDGGVYSLTMDLSSLDAKNKPRRKKKG